MVMEIRMSENKLPEGWRESPIGVIAELNPRKPPKSALPGDAEVSFVPMKAVDAEDGRITNSESRRFAKVRSGYTAFRDDDVIVAKITPCMENGKAAIARDLLNGFGFGSSEFHVLRSGSKLLPEYLFYFLRQLSFRQEAEAHMTGSVGQKRVPASFIGEHPIPYPPLPEQKRIVAKLDEIMAEIKTAKGHLERAKELIRKFRQSVLNAAVTGKLTEGWRRRRHKPAWESELACNVCRKVQNGKTPREGFIEEPGIPFLKVYNIVDQKVNFDYRPQYIPLETHAGKMSRSITLPGDVLMNIVGPPLGKVAIVPSNRMEWNINQAITLFRPGERVTSEWLYILLSSGTNVRAIDNETKGIVGQKNISLTQCRHFEIPLPDIDEQLEIARIANALMGELLHTEIALESTLIISGNIQSAVLSSAFKGELYC